MTSQQSYLDKIKQDIKKDLPSNAKITAIEFEGPEIAIYSASPEFIEQQQTYVRKIVQKLRKRIVVRSDPQIRMDNDEAVKVIKELVSEDSNISKIMFDENLGEIIIEAQKPGLVIGKSGTRLTKIKNKTMWIPRVIRTSPLESRTVDLVRGMLQKERAAQKEIFRKIGLRIHRPLLKKELKITLTALGGYREVGRSATLIQTNESSVLLDCGLNVGNQKDLYPHLDLAEVDLGTLDAVILSHAHLDHSGLVPFLFKWGYDGPIYMTEPTMHLSTMLQLDNVNICSREGRPASYSKNDIKKTVLHTYCLEMNRVTDIAPDIKLTFYNAGHILGSVLSHLHFGNGDHNLVYSGDYKFMNTNLLQAAACNFPRLETLMIESTYGGLNDVIPGKAETEKITVQILNKTLRQGGKVLIPVLAVGRAQEIMVVLEEFMSRKMIEKVPIFVDGMISEATAIHTTHPNHLSANLRKKIFHQGRNPFTSEIFNIVDNHSIRDEIIGGGPCIIMATSGMLQGGPSLHYLKGIANDELSTLFFCSYQVEGTLGRRIQKGYRQFNSYDSRGKRQPIRIKLDVQTVEGFSGHSSRVQTMSFIRKLKPRPKQILTVHGTPRKCMGLASVIHKKLKTETRSMENGERIIVHNSDN